MSCYLAVFVGFFISFLGVNVEYGAHSLVNHIFVNAVFVGRIFVFAEKIEDGKVNIGVISKALSECFGGEKEHVVFFQYDCFAVCNVGTAALQNEH